VFSIVRSVVRQTMRHSRISLLFVFLSALLAGIPAAHAAATCPANNIQSAPPADFTLNGDGTVTHLKTGLMWKQCAEGLSDAACATGSATAMNWDAALSAAFTPFASHSDWRLPNIKELQSIVETACYQPAINETVFPNTPGGVVVFWSSTSIPVSPTVAFGVDFSLGDNIPGLVKSTGTGYVRLVRGGQTFDTYGLPGQSITFGAPPTIAPGGTGTVSATSTSGLAVSFSSLTSAICTVSGSTVTDIEAGTCTIAADQGGDPKTYRPAQEATQSIVVNPPAPVASKASGTVAYNSTATALTLAITGVVTSVAVTVPPSHGTATASGTGISYTPANGYYGTDSFSYTATNSGGTSPAVVFTVTVSQPSTPVANLAVGWNLLGNSVNAPLAVAGAFGNAANVSSVWKWETRGTTPGITYPAWAFYAPSFSTSSALAQYAASKGYDVLTTINGGEGFWVNANAVFPASLPAGTSIASSVFADQSNPSNNALPRGWSLIATGDNPTPGGFVNAIAFAQPVSPNVATSLITLWAWDSTTRNWYFYSPSLANATTLTNYISSKNYEDFTAKNKTLDQTTGFWVNHP
jgi:hypothetical protein